MARYHNAILTDSDIARLIEIGSNEQFLAVYIVVFNEPEELLFFRITNGPDLKDVVTTAVDENIRSREDLTNVAVFLSIPNKAERVEEIWIPESLYHHADHILEWLENQR
jgi:hypothetical protein